jgi:hypothetical protein
MTTSTDYDTGRTLNGGTQGDDKLGQAASNLADQASRTAEAKASNTMLKASDTLHQFAEAIRSAGDGMREQQPAMAGAADTTAERVEEFSGYLREHDARDVLDTVQREARRQPALVIGGGLALGLLVGRFLRSGSPDSSKLSGTDTFRSAGQIGSAGYGASTYTGAPASYAGTDMAAGSDVGTTATATDDLFADDAPTASDQRHAAATGTASDRPS